MSTRQMSHFYQAGRMGHSTVPSDVDLFGLKAKRERDTMSHAAQLEQDLQTLIHKQQLELEAKKADLEKNVYSSKEVTDILKGMQLPDTEENRKRAAGDYSRMVFDNAIQKVKMEGIGLQNSDAQKSVNFGINARATGLPLDKLFSTTPTGATSIGPSLSALGSPEGNRMTTGSNVNEQDTTEGGMSFTDPKTGKQITLPGKPVKRTFMTPGKSVLTQPPVNPTEVDRMINPPNMFSTTPSGQDTSFGTPIGTAPIQRQFTPVPANGQQPNGNPKLTTTPMDGGGNPFANIPGLIEYLRNLFANPQQKTPFMGNF